MQPPRIMEATKTVQILQTVKGYLKNPASILV